MKIFLSGYMGSGKSFIAQHLAKHLHIHHLDLDHQIALIEEQSIPEIFKTKGELYFRNRETNVLEDILEEPASLVVAMGGGTPCYGRNLEILKSSGDVKIVYLKASVKFLTERLFRKKKAVLLLVILKIRRYWKILSENISLKDHGIITRPI